MTGKCPNCAATLNSTDNKMLIYCPYCGFKFEKPESIFDYKKYELEHKEQVRQRKVKEENRKDKVIGIVCGGVLIGIMVITFLIVFISHTNEDHRLNALVQEITLDIQSGNYDEALIKTQMVQMTEGWSHSEEEKWDNERKYLTELIQHKMQESK